MISNKLSRKILKITKELSHIPNANNKHFTFFVKRNTILSIGWCDYYIRPKECDKYKYGEKMLHSELAALIKFRGDYSDLQRCSLINTRINRHNIIGMSKPCECCNRMIKEIGFKKVFIQISLEVLRNYN